MTDEKDLLFEEKDPFTLSEYRLVHSMINSSSWKVFQRMLKLDLESEQERLEFESISLEQLHFTRGKCAAIRFLLMYEKDIKDAIEEMEEQKEVEKETEKELEEDKKEQNVEGDHE